MKLSEAIIKGSENTTQGFGVFFSRLHPDDCMEATFKYSPSCCALGAAMIGMNEPEKVRNEGTMGYLESTFPGLDEVKVHPITGIHQVTCATIISLNDKYIWTREEIAKWLEEQGL